MPEDQGTQGLMKNGLLLAAAIIVIRIILEQAGASGAVTTVFGVAWLYFVFPVLFALRIAGSGEEKPYKTLFRSLVTFSLGTRLMVMVTYMAAFLLSWQAPRFDINNGGVVGPDVSFMNGFLLIPLRNVVIWVILATVVGMIIGGIVLAIKRKSAAPAPTS